MATLRDTIGYICFKLPHQPHVLRLVYLTYLIDWSSAVVRGRRLTSLKWVLGAQGPQAESFRGFLVSSKDFRLTGTGGPSAIVTFVGMPTFPTLNGPDRSIAEEIVKVTETLDWSQIQRLIYQSEPVVMSRLDQVLELESIAANKRRAIVVTAARQPPKAGLADPGGNV